MIWWIVSLIIIIVILSIIIFNLYSQVKQLEDEVVSENKFTWAHEQKVMSIYNFLLNKMINAKSELDRIDKRGSFSSDDEVGFAFKVINNSIDLLINEIKSLKAEDGDT